MSAMALTARSALTLLAAAVILGTIPTVLAHGDDGAMDMGTEEPKPDPDSYATTYFAYPEHRGVLYAHIGLMVASWIVLLPIGMSSFYVVSREKLTQALQVLCFQLHDHDIPSRPNYSSSRPMRSASRSESATTQVRPIYTPITRTTRLAGLRHGLCLRRFLLGWLVA
jgi:hypothetical protein